MYRDIFLDAPNVGCIEKEYLSLTIDSGYVSTVGPYVQKFEEEFAKYLNVKRAVATQSGTSAIHISLYELGIKEGDEVIIPALTFVATANPVLYVKAKPIFVDVDIDTWNIDPSLIEESITRNTKAIIPVHLYGNPCNMDEILRIAKKYNLYVIEDATESMGAKYKNKYTGTFGDLGCFSFNGNKLITTGGGGMVVGNEEKKLEHIKFLVNQAKDSTQSYYHSEMGFNYRMTNIEAALGLAQIKRKEEFLEKKRNFNRIYKRELEGIPDLVFQKENSDAESSHWITAILFKKSIDILTLQEKLRNRGIPTRRIFMPIVEFPYYKKLKKGEYPNSYYIFERGLCLPSSTLNSYEDIKYVCKTLKELIGAK